jgi:hypothetical protein
MLRRASVLVLSISILGSLWGPTRAGAAERDLIAWSAKQLPRNTERALDRLKGVKATTVWSGSMFMKTSRTPAGRVVDRRSRYKIPMDVAFIEPREYAPFAPRKHRDAIKDLSGKKALFGRTEVGLRDGHARLKMRFNTGRAKSIGFVSNQASQGYEMLMAQPAPRKAKSFRTVLIEKGDSVPRRRIKRTIRRLIGSKPLELSSDKQVPFLRHGQLVQPQMLVKKAFGEFRLKPTSGRSIDIPNRWESRHMRSDRVPLLGRVRCHRKIFPQLRRATRELRRKGKGGTINSYSGCYVPRFISSYDGYGIGPAKRLSRHAWGIALDINAPSNGFGTRGNQPRALIRTFKKWGFGWGGRWAVPDPMHFEWDHFEP